MAKNRTAKTETLDALSKSFEGAKGIVFANFAGLNVKGTTVLRRKCRAANVTIIVAKKTLLKRAFEKAGVKSVDPRALSGGLAVVFGYSDEVAAARLLREFAVTNEALQFVGGLIPSTDGWTYLDVRGVTDLSKLPGMQELRGQLVGTLNAPVSNFVSVLSGNIRALVQVLSAVQQTKT